MEPIIPQWVRVWSEGQRSLFVFKLICTQTLINHSWGILNFQGKQQEGEDGSV